MPYIINGQSASITEPQNQGGTLWVPLREVATALGGTLDWDADNRVAIGYFGDSIATLKIDDPTADINGEKSELQEAPRLQDGETWVPVRFFNLLGYNLAVDPQNSSVDITSV
jgi:hypothetical protein